MSGWAIGGASLRDVPVILDITRASNLAAIGEPDWTVDEIVATLTAANHDPARDSWLVFDPDGSPAAWAYLDNPTRGRRDSVEVYVVPGRGEPAFGSVLDLAIRRVAQRARDAGHAEVTLRAGAVANETGYLEVLKEKGFGFLKRHARMRRVLTGDEPAPDGFDIRPVRADDEVELRRFHEVLEAAFADTGDRATTGYDGWRAAITPATWDECLVASVDGVIVGVLQSSDQAAEQGQGWVRNLGVLRGHRRTGIGAALLRTAFAAYAANGRTSAGLGVDMTNPTGAFRLYTNAGMSVAFAVDAYERPVTAA